MELPQSSQKNCLGHFVNETAINVELLEIVIQFLSDPHLAPIGGVNNTPKVLAV